MKTLLVSIFVIVLTLGQLNMAHAGLINIAFTETNTGVTVEGDGSFDLTDLTLEFEDIDTSSLMFVNPLEGGFGFGNIQLADFYSIDGTQAFGTLGLTDILDGVGDYFGIAFGGSTGVAVGVTADYVSGEALSFENFIAGASFSSLGITNSPFTIVAGLNNINLTFGSELQAVSAPPAIALFISAIFGLGALTRRKKCDQIG